METWKKFFLVLLSMITCASYSRTPVSPQENVSIQIFYDELEPYGQWIEYPAYGYVWIPSVDETFVPYSGMGYWAFTDYGWTWISDYSWGWAPFHYGRWDFLEPYGWIWIPDVEWAPAWVVWSHCPGYYGWAPLRPGMVVSASAGNDYYGHREDWTFVDEKNIASHDSHKYYAPRNNNEQLLKNATVIRNMQGDKEQRAGYFSGPERTEVERVSGNAVKTFAVKKKTEPGQSLSGNQVVIYRPELKREGEGGIKPAPHKVTPLKEVKPVQMKKENIPPTENKPPVNGEKRNDIPPPQNIPQQKREVPVDGHKQAPPVEEKPRSNPQQQKQMPPQYEHPRVNPPPPPPPKQMPVRKGPPHK